MMDYEYYMGKALDLAGAAFSAGEFPVGCVIVYRDEIIASGSRIGTLSASPNEIDHAEMIALRRLSGIEKKIDLKKTSIFSTFEPCLMCFGAILLSGIGEMVYAYEDVMGGATRCDLTKLGPLYGKTKVSIIANVLRRESLELLKAYFSNPENKYWRGSPLAEYTLSQ